MPLGIGRYSEHVKIATEICDEDADVPDRDNEPWPVRFIGQQNIVAYNSRDATGIMNQIYNKNYSPLNSLMNLKRYELTIDASGITAYLSSSKKGSARNLFMSYTLSDIILITADYQHDRLFGVVFHGPLRNCMLHLYLCNSEDDVKILLNKCSEHFAENKGVKQIEKASYSDGLEIIHYQPYEVASESEEDSPNGKKESIDSNTHSCENGIRKEKKTLNMKTSESPPVDIREFKIPYTNSKTESNPVNPVKEPVSEHEDLFNFGEFQMVSTTTKTTGTTNLIHHLPDSPRSEIPSPPQPLSCKNVSLLDDDDFEDEFAELALKRNVYIPDHLQDKGIESRLLFPENITQQSSEQNIKPSFFSSYNKLQS